MELESNLISKFEKKFKSLVKVLAENKGSTKFHGLEFAYQTTLKTFGDEKHMTGKYQVDFLLDMAKSAVLEIGLGLTSVNAILLSEAYKRQVVNDEIIKKNLNDAQLLLMVKGLTKVSGIDAGSGNKDQAENFRKLLLNLAKDMRVILIKIVEHLHVMRNLNHLSESVQIKVASEASFLYAPLAHRLGLYIIKSEFEDLSLKFTDRKTYNFIARKLDEKMKARKKFIDDFVTPIENNLKKEGFKFEIKGRPKSIHSIWNKMKKKEVDFEDIYDLFAIRIILDTETKNEKADCWRVYSIVTDLYQPNPKRLRDWISVPKTNGYESLHTTVVGTDGKWVEVQIRTARMNEIAEKGFAAHWKYKGIEEEQGLDEWLVKIREILETPEPDAAEFIDDFKLSLYSKEIFVFTPNGELRKFPAGATVLDFAFDIHSDLGASCVGAKVNGKNVTIKYVMQNGDAIEIIKSKNQSPKMDWLSFVVTSKAKSKIKQKLNEDKFKLAENGKELLKRRLKNWKLEFNDEVIRKLLDTYNYKVAQDLYYDLAIDKLDISNLKEVVTEKEPTETEEGKKINIDTIVGQEYKEKVRHSNDFLVIQDKLDNVDYKLAKCCNPIFGDKVFGFVTINEGIKIHRLNCPNARQMLSKYGYRVVNAKWTRTDGDTLFPVELKITGVDNFEILTSINDIISKDNRVKMRSIQMDSNEGLFEGKLKIMVKDITHLDYLVNKLALIKGIIGISRIENI